MWRTGSTYFWNKLRRQDRYRAYYEPFNEALLRLKPEPNPSHWAEQTRRHRHPDLEAPYFAEYRLKKRGGTPDLTPALCYGRFYLEEDEEDRELTGYLRRLSSEAAMAGQKPVFQCSRTLLRSGWLKRNFGGDHLLLLRDPRQVWLSFKSQGSYFAGAICLIVSQNRARRALAPLAEQFRLPKINTGRVGADLTSYGKVAEDLGAGMYGLFHAFYMLTFLYNLRHADLMIDMDMVSTSPRHASKAETALRGRDIFISLADCRVPQRDAPFGDDVDDVERENLQFLRTRLGLALAVPRANVADAPHVLSPQFRAAAEPFLV